MSSRYCSIPCLPPCPVFCILEREKTEGASMAGRTAKAALTGGKTRWDLTPLFANDNDRRMAEERRLVQEKSYAFINAWKDRDDYLSDPAVLRQALDQYEEWKRNCG